jgi:uncharacterized membrane protein HdeD (DUF308 family)
VSDVDAGFGTAVPPPPRPIEYADADPSGWWVSVLGGLALVVLGVWLLTNLFESVVVLAWLVGISLIVGGITEVVALHGERGLGKLPWVSGALLVAAGLAVIAWPDVTLWALAVLAGLGLLLAGVLRVLLALADRDRPGTAVNLGIGAVGIAVGVLVMAWPGATLVVLAVLVGLRAVLTGVVAIGVGWQLHRLTG